MPSAMGMVDKNRGGKGQMQVSGQGGLPRVYARKVEAL